jgi:Ni,Fe-hydrogenase I small subunit
VASTAATQPSVAEIALGALRGFPKVAGVMGVPDDLGWEWMSKAGIPIVCVPGCPSHPDNLSETLTYQLCTATGPGAVATSPGRARAR